MRDQLLEEALSYRFAQPELLSLALKHPSMGMPHNQRLEFLGDAVLQLCVSDMIYRRFGGVREGELTAIRQKLVCQEGLAEIANRIGLGKWLKMEHSFAENGGRENPAVLSDAMGAVLAAVYLDGGFAAALKTVDLLWTVEDQKQYRANAKSILQEKTQQRGEGLPEYVLEGEEGPDHDRRFTMAVYLKGRLLGRGSAKSKKLAEQEAAGLALEALDRESEENS